MMKKIITTLTILLISLWANSQNKTLYDLYNHNNLLLNPASFVHNDILQVYSNSHVQWFSVAGSPKIENIDIAYSKNAVTGYGLSISNKSVGLFNFAGVNAVYAYKLYFADSLHTLKMGVSLGAENRQLFASNVVGVDVNDNTLNNYYNKTTITSSCGLSYNFKDFQADLIFPDIINGKHFYSQAIAYLSYNYQLNNSIDLRPSVLVNTGVEMPTTADVNFQLAWKRMLWTQLTYRTNKSYVFGIGAIFKKISIGYAYEYNYNFSSSMLGTHEIQIGYRMGREKKPKKRLLSGKIVDMTDKQGINATLKIFNNDVLIDSLTTKDGGIFSTKITEGKTYDLLISADGYFSISKTITMPFDTILTNQDFELLPKTIPVSGKIISTYNQPVSNAKITVLEGNKIVKTAKTDQNGDFNVVVGRNKEYKLNVEAQNCNPISQNINTKISDKKISLNFTLHQFVTIKGTITDSKTNKPIAAEISIVDYKTNKTLETTSSNAQNGKYMINLEHLDTVLIIVNSQGYMFGSDKIIITKPDENITKNIKLQKVDEGAKIVLENVTFDKGKSTLRPQSMPEINRLIEILKANPDIRIELSGHTDNTGSYSTNKRLSKARAQAVADYMISQGIDPGRLKVVGYGPDKPRADNSTEEGRELNRRVEAKVIK